MNKKVVLPGILIVTAVAVNAFFLRNDKPKHETAVKLREVKKGEIENGARAKYFKSEVCVLNKSIIKGNIDEVLTKHVDCAECLNSLIRKRLARISKKEIKFAQVSRFKVEDCGDHGAFYYWDVKCNVVEGGNVTFRYVVENRKPKLINVL
jgi:hypothetical protein